MTDAVTEHAGAVMELPKSEPFEHGIQIGVYRGLNAAIDLLDKLNEEGEEL